MKTMRGGAGSDTFRVRGGAEPTLLLGGDGVDTAVIDWASKTAAVSSYPAYGPMSRGPAWVQAADSDRIEYADLLTATEYRQIEKLQMRSGSGDDVLWGGAAVNEIDAGGGNDRVYGSVGADLLKGGDGDDFLAGDYWWWAGGDDRLFGERGRDTLMGDLGDDLLDGGRDDDLLIGGGGNDTLVGGHGRDVAAFAGNRADYEVRADGRGGFTVVDLVGTDGADRLSGVETLRFADGDLDVVGANPGAARPGRVGSLQASFDDWLF
ncbi:MAG TPA: calcium-binding protein [Caulobacteraceae bacterium]|nr:calcium-binding protein [Caulobacteraceae bacterium]